MKTVKDIKKTRIFAAIDTAAFKHNYLLLTKAIPNGTNTIAVIKANGYGHGALKLAEILENDNELSQCKPEFFAVAEIEEARELRMGGIKTPILILGRTDPTYASELIDLDISQCVYSFEYGVELINNIPKGKRLKCHIKLDSGMSRLGFSLNGYEKDTVSDIVMLSKFNVFTMEGIFTHFAESDSLSCEFTLNQKYEFDRAIELLSENGLTFKYIHTANSAASFTLDGDYNLVRLGIMMYGSYPSDEIKELWESKYPPLKPVMSLCAKVNQVHIITPGMTVGYGRAFSPDDIRVVACIGAGYADGILRSIANGGSIIKKDCKIVGRICMDMMFADVTESAPMLNEGDTVTLFGSYASTGDNVTADDWAKAADTINYEVFCSVSSRVPRFYY